VPHLQVTEVLRRIERACLEEDMEVITQEVGTFYKQSRAATTRTLNEVRYQVPAREVVQLRPRRFPGRESRIELRIVRSTFEFAVSPTFFTSTDIPGGGQVIPDGEPFTLGFEDIEGSFVIEFLEFNEIGDSGTSELVTRLNWNIPPLHARRLAPLVDPVPDEFILTGPGEEPGERPRTLQDNHMAGSYRGTFFNVLNGESFGWSFAHINGNGEAAVGNVSLRFERFLVDSEIATP